MIAKEMDLLWLRRRNIGTVLISYCFIIVCVVTLASANPDPTSIPSTTQPNPTPLPLCNATSGIFQNNSSYEQNLNFLLTKLVTSATPSELVKEQVLGNESTDTVYGYSQCLFTSLSQDDCNLCLRHAANETSQLCPNARSATMFYDECYLGYGPLNQTSDASHLIVCLVNTAHYSSGSPFSQNLKEVWSMLRQEAPLTANPVAFTYGEPPDAVFGFAQCHNLWQRGCVARFDSAVSASGMSKGFRAVFTDAFFRYESYAFYTGEFPFQIIASPTPSPTPSAQHKQRKSSRHVPIIVILGIVIGGSTVFVTCIFVVICIRNKTSKTFVILKESPPQTQFFKGCRMFSYKSLKDATRNFHKENELGQGGFGVVYKGMLCDGSEVAIKLLSQGSMQGNEEFLNEVAIITSIQHKNLVKLKGCCIEGEARLLVYEYLEYKSLDFSLFGKHILDWKTRYNISLGIARGLEYLHEESEPRILHRDIKVSNILLDKSFQPKISDFGLARFLPYDQSSIETLRMAGTRGYLAPEALYGCLTEKADVFSFGVLLLEIVSGRKNLDIHRPNETYIVNWASQLCEEGRQLELVDPTLEREYVKIEALHLINIAMLCIQGVVELRPKMSNVVSMLLA